MKCLRCGSQMQYKGTDQIQLGRTGFFIGTLSNLLSGALDVAIFECLDCGKIEFYNPEKAYPRKSAGRRASGYGYDIQQSGGSVR